MPLEPPWKQRHGSYAGHVEHEIKEGVQRRAVLDRDFYMDGRMQHDRRVAFWRWLVTTLIALGSLALGVAAFIKS